MNFFFNTQGKFLKILCRLALLAALILPFILREIDSRLEAYPAVVFPSGAGKVSTKDDAVTYDSAELLAVFSDGSERKINPRSFFGPFNKYEIYITRHKFGLEGRNFTRNLDVGPWNFTITDHYEITPSQRREALDWIRAQLIRLGVGNARTLRHKTLEVTVDKTSGIELARKVTGQYDVDLAQ